MYEKIRRKSLAMFLTLAMVVCLMPAQTVSAGTARQEIIFIENNVTDYQMLADSAYTGTEIYILDSKQDGLEQIAGALEGRSGIDAIHIVSHGSEGQLDLGKTILSADNLNKYSAALEKIGFALREQGDILLYGCNVAKGINGGIFIADFAALTGADIAASTTPTGSAALGGDWNLEASTGKLESGMVISDTGMDNYPHLLNTIYVNSDTGNDASGDGTSSSPYKTFTKGYSMVSNGGTLDLTGTFTWTDADETGDAADVGFRISKSITIKGQSTGNTIIQAAVTSDSAISRLFYFSNGLNVTFKNLEMRYGKSSGYGGALNIKASYSNRDSVTIQSCYIHDNTCTSSGAMYSGGGGVELYAANLTITNSTISNNQSDGRGGGIYQDLYSNLTLTNSTVACNNSRYSDGGGICVYNSSDGSLLTNITNCTIAENKANNSGGGIHQSKGSFILKNTIIANNDSAASGTGKDYSWWLGSVTDNGNNIIEYYGTDGSGLPPLSGTTITGEQAGLKLSGTLAGNGTLTGTPTLALSSDSIAANAGDGAANGSVSIPSADQRGMARNGNVDIGAFEYGGIVPSAPTVSTSEASGVTSTEAVLVGSVNANNGSTTVTFEYGTTASYGSRTTATQSPVNGAVAETVSYALSGLAPNTDYHYRVTGENVVGTTIGTDKLFTTSAVPPTVITNAPTAVTSTGAILNGSVNANNASTVVTFEYGTTTSYGGIVTASQSPVAGTSSTTVSYTLSGLALNTTYHYRIVGVNTAGTTNGSDATFTTSVLPTVITNPVSGVTSTGAILAGSVNANNASTTITFEYGTTTSYGNSATASQSPANGTSAKAMSYTLSGLIPNTTYHYRVVGTNTAGTANGLDEIFATSAAAPAVITNAPTAVTSTGAILNGSVNANNASTAATFEYGTTTSYGGIVTASQSPVAGISATTVSYTLSGLAMNTTYHYRIVGVNTAGTTNGSDGTFTTSALPTAITNPVSGVTSTGAILAGSVNANNASTTITFEYGTTTSYGTSTAAIGSPVSGTALATVNCTLSGLIPNTTYHYRVVGINMAGTATGSDETFATSAAAPAVITNAPTAVTSTGAILNGSVNPNNASTAVTFEYGTTTNYGSIVTASPSPVAGTTATTVSYTLSGLAMNTTYHYRIVGVNTAGTTNGADRTFSTAAAAPMIITNPSTGVTSTGAILAGSVNANNASTTVIFEYGTTISYGTSMAAIGSPVSGTALTIVSCTLSGLIPNTTYHYRVVGTNTAGTANGSDGTFDTSASAPTVITNSVTSVTSNGASLNGRVNANNSSTTVIFEYGTTTSYGTSTAAIGSPVSGTALTTVSCTLSGLIPNTTYHYRVVGVNTAGTANGLDAVFTTSGLPAGHGGGSNVTAGVLNGQTIKNMEEKNEMLEIKTETATYTIPASEINIDAVTNQFGNKIDPKDIKVNISISEPSSNIVKIVEDTAAKNGYQLLVDPVEFRITCAVGDKTAEISKFSNYVERMIALPDVIDPSKVTTGIILNKDGSFSHVPTTIVKIEGKYYAKISSLTNSIYSVIYNPVKFTDTEKHWAKASVNNMGSRLIIGGVGTNRFEPNRDITRAEFAAIIVRALGLSPDTLKNNFSDVADSKWYSSYIGTAAFYGIISGYDSDTFAPNEKITREQAMTMIARATKLTGIEVKLTENDISSLLVGYSDGMSTSNYAKESIGVCLETGIVSGTSKKTISPDEYVTRAEVAVMTERLLQKSGLI